MCAREMTAVRSGLLGLVFLMTCFLTAVAPTRAAEPRTVAIWVPGAEDGLAARQVAFWIKRVEERLPQRFVFEVQTGAACPGDADLLGQARGGRIDLAVVGDAVIDETPRLSLFRLPWVFRDRGHVQRTMYAGLEDEIRTHVEDVLKIIVIGVYENSFHSIRADRLISGPEDLARRKILINDGRKMRDVMRVLGAVPQKYPMDKADEALEAGIIDSVDGPLDLLARLPIAEKLPVITLTHHVYEPSFLIASRAFWEKLSRDERAALTEVGVDFTDIASQLAVTYFEAARKRLPKKIAAIAFTPERFSTLIARQRAAYEKVHGTDWTELVDIGRDGDPPTAR
jgi:TRAP-type C4-dicarboxylate transport system substrate-binding protein